jgi:hypothetical protein
MNWPLKVVGRPVEARVEGEETLIPSSKVAGQRIQQGDFPAPRDLRPEVPKPLEAVCLRAMPVRPSDRYSSAQTLAVDVEHFLADEPVAAYQEPLILRGRRWARKHRVFVIGVAALLVPTTAAPCGC